MAAKDTALAKSIVQAVFDFNPGLILYALAGSKMIEEADKYGIATASEVFADRSYQDDGLLTPRSVHNALIANKEDAVDQVLGFALKQEVKSVNGNRIAVKAETVCLHGDGEHAVEFAKLIASRLNREGIIIKAPIR
jgi:5-oxoprolinase (ATP-hydrolysing) subunit A